MTHRADGELTCRQLGAVVTVLGGALTLAPFTGASVRAAGRSGHPTLRYGPALRSVTGCLGGVGIRLEPAPAFARRRRRRPPSPSTAGQRR
ncbi:hypothetical protein ACFSL4_27530 [Streptomyces caeni]|uniref:Uncharacterized protein n=1 Tax=Streptomyces caeni TaxID=2307231 RepID=A0ABW4J0V2_9ACTN